MVASQIRTALLVSQEKCPQMHNTKAIKISQWEIAAAQTAMIVMVVALVGKETPLTSAEVV